MSFNAVGLKFTILGEEWGGGGGDIYLGEGDGT